MTLPVFTHFDRLDAAPRKFLLFTACNVASWQSLVGPALVLFARKLDMPASWVGFLISFMPLAMLLVVFTVPLVMRFGPKRVMMTAWMLRNLTSCLVFLMPWAMIYWGPRASWIVLGAATLSFCVMRALGSGGWFPWLHEVVPNTQRATFFSVEIAIAQCVTIGIILLQGFILRGEPGLNQFFIIYAIGIVAGLSSLYWMSRVPGGASMPSELADRGAYGYYRQALADLPFVRFVVIASLGYSATAWYNASSVLYMRDMLLLSSTTIMIVLAIACLGTLFTIQAWARFTDHSGSGHAMALTMIGHAAAAFAFLFLVPGARWATFALIPLAVLTQLFSAAFAMASHRAMLNYVKTDGRVGYTNCWVVGTALALGLTPIAVGQVINVWHGPGFTICFSVATALGLVIAVLSQYTIRDSTPNIHPGLPRRPLHTLTQIATITAGRHESNR